MREVCLRFGVFRVAALLSIIGFALPTWAAAQSTGAQVTAQAPAPAAAPAPALPTEIQVPAPPAQSTAAVGSNAAPTPADQSASELPWDLAHRRFSTWNGPTGGLFLLDGRAGEPGAVRVQLGIDAFSGSDYLRDGDHIEVSNQSLALSVTATDNFEFYANLNNRATQETRPDSLTLDALGDLALGVKVGTKLGDVVAIGGELRAMLANKSGGEGFDWGATSLALRSALSIDLQGLPRPIPFIARFNLGYVLDNSAQLVSDTENARYASLGTTIPKSDEPTHLVSRFERLGLGINRVDRVALGAGFELPLRVAERFYLHPLVEWQVGVPVNRQNYDCPSVLNVPNAGTTHSAEDTCYERNTGAIPMDLALGLRVVPPARGLSFLLGVDIGLTGTSTFVRELAPVLPWRLLIALSYDYDARPVEPKTVVVEKPVPAVVAPQAPKGRALGLVTAPNGSPIAEARVQFLDRQITTMLTGPDGKFTTEPVAPGQVSVEVSQPDYETTRCVAVIPEAGGDTPLNCVLTPKPQVGTLQGTLQETSGIPIPGARVIITGPTNALAVTDPRGAFTTENLPPGTYEVRIEAGGYFTRQVNETIEARKTTSLNMNLTRKPLTPTIQVVGDAIEAPTLTFGSEESATLTAAANEAIAEIAELMQVRPDLYLQIQGFGSSEALSLARAQAIKQRLVEDGVPELHIEAVAGTRRTLRLFLHR